MKDKETKKPYIGEPMKTLMNQKVVACPNIYQRMLSIMNEVQYILKVDKAAKGLPYKFVSHDQVTGVLHMPMVKFGVYTKTDILECTQEGNRTFVKAQISFINADDPKDMINVTSFGYGIDNQDKGPGKAISYATKMALLKNFMLETGEDPERDNIDFKKDEKLSEDQIQRLKEMMNGDKEAWNLISDKFGYSKVSAIPADQYDKVMTELMVYCSRKRAKAIEEMNNE